MSRIPRHFHFIFGLRPQTEPFHILYYLSLESCLRINRPERLTLYHHYEPYGRYWDLIKARIELVRVPLNQTVANAGYDSKLIGEKLRYAHHADFIRLEKLHQHGGVYADIDTIFIRPIPDALFEKPFVIGREGEVLNDKTGKLEKSLCNALMLAEPGSEFARIWLERMPEALDGSWSNHSCQLAERLYQENPELVHVEPPASFFPVMWTPADLHALLEGRPVRWPDSYSVHLWAHLWWSPDRTDFSPVDHEQITEHALRRGRTMLASLARPFLPEPVDRPEGTLMLHALLLLDAARDAIRPRVRRRRFRALRWQLEPPLIEDDGARFSLTLRGRFLAGSPVPARIHARLGRRRLTAFISPKDPAGDSWFTLGFTTTPGTKWIGLEAVFESGAVTPIGRHLLRCVPDAKPRTIFYPRIRFEPSPPAPVTGGTPDFTLFVHDWRDLREALDCAATALERAKPATGEVFLVATTPRESASLKSLPSIANFPAIDLTLSGEGVEPPRLRGRFVALMAAGLDAQPGWMQALNSTFDRNPDCGLATGKIIDARGRLPGNGHHHMHPRFNYVRAIGAAPSGCGLLTAGLFCRLPASRLFSALRKPEDGALTEILSSLGQRAYYQPAAVFSSRGKKLIPGAFFGRRPNETQDHEHGADAILVIDRHIPKPDRDAGSRSVEHLIRFLRAEGHHVIFMPGDLAYSPVYTPALEQLGVEIVDRRLGPLALDAWLHRHARRVNRVFLSRADVVAEHLPAIKHHTRAPILFYGHDLFSRTYERAHQITGALEDRRRSEEWTALENTVFSQVDVAFYPSAIEVRLVGERFPALRSEVLPLLSAPDLPPPADAAPLEEKTGVLFVGNFQHAPNVDGLLWFLREIFPAVQRAHPGIRMTIVGGHAPSRLLEFSSSQVVFEGRLTDVELLKRYQETRLVVAPLRQGGGVKGKVIEALWHRRPVLTTPVGAEGVPEAETCIAVAPPESFAEEMNALYADIPRLEDLAVRGRAMLLRHFSTDAYRRVLQTYLPRSPAFQNQPG